MTRKFVLTGGPGTGKSTLLSTLQQRGIYTMKEAAEYIIERELRREGKILPWVNRDLFQKKLLETQLQWEREIPSEIEISFQDRGIADAIAYYRIDSLQPPKEIVRAAKDANYERVFILDPLNTYQRTEIRRESPERAREIHRQIARAYEELGYNLTRIPAASLNFRTELILDLIEFDQKALEATK